MNGMILLFTIYTFFCVRALGLVFDRQRKFASYKGIKLDSDPSIFYFIITMASYAIISFFISENSFVIWLAITLCCTTLTQVPTITSRAYGISIAIESLLFPNLAMSDREYIIVIIILGVGGFLVARLWESATRYQIRIE